MELRDFAQQHRLTIKKDSCGDEVILGRPRNLKCAEDRCHIYVHSAEKFGLALMLASVGKWHNRTKEALASGFTMWQDGADEGNLLFDPTDKSQAKLAIKMAGCRSKAVLSPERLANLQERGARLSSLRQTTV